MEEVNFGKTNIELKDLKQGVDLKRASKILSKKGISDPNQKLDLYLDKICGKIQRLPEEGKRFSWRAENSVYRIYITEILLQRTHGTSVEKIYHEFFDRFSDPSELYNAEESEIREEVKSLGFQNRRVRCLKSTGEMLRNNGFEVPEDEEKLKEPWRVGEYAAKATLLFGFGRSVELVDSNIASAAENLLEYPHTSAPHKDEELRALMFALTPSSPDIARAFYFALIDFKFTE